MTGRSIRWTRHASALACGLAWALTVAACTAASRAHPPGGVSAPSLRVIQFNLCDSGLANCYTGRSVSEAAAVIRHRRPDIVTLNEVCRADVSALRRAMSEIHHRVSVVSAFKAAVDRRTGSAYRCRNGQPYGVGVVTALPAANSAYRTFGGRYPTQDRGDPEERVWLCIYAVRDFYACTTHTASTRAAVAVAQCRYLIHQWLPALLSREAVRPVVLGADLNLLPGRSPGPQACLTNGYHRTDDGARQDVVTSSAIKVRDRTIVDMHGTTDHPGLLVDLADVQLRR